MDDLRSEAFLAELDAAVGRAVAAVTDVGRASGGNAEAPLANYDAALRAASKRRHPSDVADFAEVIRLVKLDVESGRREPLPAAESILSEYLDRFGLALAARYGLLPAVPIILRYLSSAVAAARHTGAQPFGLASSKADPGWEALLRDLLQSFPRLFRAWVVSNAAALRPHADDSHRLRRWLARFSDAVFGGPLRISGDTREGPHEP